MGYEVREYLLDKWGRKCAYCGKKDIPLQVEHIIPKTRGGSDRVSNLTLACNPCNQKKGNTDIEVFLKKDPELLKKIKANLKQPLKDAAAVNTTRRRLYDDLKEIGLPLETGTGSRTKFNRSTRHIPKTHWLDAACVGESTPENLKIDRVVPFSIKAMGHGVRQRCRTDKYGFPVRHAPKAKSFMGFQTGDLVKAVVPSGKAAGVHVGRVSIRFSPTFYLNGINHIHHKYMTILQHSDGYKYEFLPTAEKIAQS